MLASYESELRKGRGGERKEAMGRQVRILAGVPFVPPPPASDAAAAAAEGWSEGGDGGAAAAASTAAAAAATQTSQRGSLRGLDGVGGGIRLKSVASVRTDAVKLAADVATCLGGPRFAAPVAFSGTRLGRALFTSRGTVSPSDQATERPSKRVAVTL